MSGQRSPGTSGSQPEIEMPPLQLLCAAVPLVALFLLIADHLFAAT